MAFTPVTRSWPGKRAVMFVHGIGDASNGGAGAFPVDQFRAAMGAQAAEFAIYSFNYDFINDWAATKTQFGAGIAALKDALKIKFGGDAVADTISEYCGDVLWPVLNGDIRLAVRDAFVAQLIQIHLDGGEAALDRGDDPLEYEVSIIAHSLGCFHTYEVLWAIATNPQYQLRPASDNFRLRTAILMASPVQLIRTVARGISALVPDQTTLATLGNPLGLPAQTVGAKATTVARRFVSITGSQDPVGGHLLGKLQPWGYMALDGQDSVINTQMLGTTDPGAALAAALSGGGAAGAAGAGLRAQDPHSWTAYIERNAAKLLQVLA
ncbi:MAG TPA: hypothetical protein VFT29_12705 [Gemmatimonadaceae bacterium]|nr:hypothetical protein [Gemmatimonadaceae bacterium]